MYLREQESTSVSNPTICACNESGVSPYMVHLFDLWLKFAKPGVYLFGSRGVENPFAVRGPQDREHFRVAVLLAVFVRLLVTGEVKCVDDDGHSAEEIEILTPVYV